MDRRFYRAGEFSKRASVTIRTLRFYDKEGLLPPSGVSAAGYRLYTDRDLVDLQQILALKFLGFSLDEIKALRSASPRRLPDVLAQQKAMLVEKRQQLDLIIEAIEETETLLQEGDPDWNSIVRVIQALQMDQSNEWVNKYFTPEQREHLQQLGEQSYSEAAQEFLNSRGPWTEEDQKKADEQWGWVASELTRLTAADADPAGAEAQAVVAQFNALISGFTGGNPEVEEGLKKMWENNNALPAEKQPLQSPWGEAEGAFLDRALAAQRENANG